MSRPILTVSQLTQAIKLNLETNFPLICLQGEISNFKQQTSGHLYFSLKDEQAQIAAVMFRVDASQLKILPKNGDQVLIKGDINVYPSKGNYQLVIRELSYLGLGELLQKLEQLKIKLHRQGWFKAAHKKAIPPFPKTIGVVTSPTGAVIQDILNILIRRFPGFHLILNPVKVQGEGAAQEIVQAIEQFNRYQMVDVMIVGRGGGSLEDLWAFNEEVVSEAIYRSHIPIICAVGHETDHCIADYVADVRAPTPSAAAEIVIAEKAQTLQRLSTIQRRIQQTLMHLTQRERLRLKGLIKHPLLANPRNFLELRMQKLDDYRIDMNQYIRQFFQYKKSQLESYSKQSLAFKPTAQLLHFKQKIGYWERSLNQTLIQQLRRYALQSNQLLKRLEDLALLKIRQEREKLTHIQMTLRAIDPKNLLINGYSILFAEKGESVINSIHQLREKQKAKVLLSDGEILITINKIKAREHTTPLSRSEFN